MAAAPDGLCAPPPRRPAPRLWRVRYEPGSGAPAVRPPDPPPPAPPAAVPGEAGPAPAEVHRSVVPVLRLALEVLDGRRPSRHLAPHVDAPVLRYWRAAAQQRRPRGPARFARIRLCLPRSGVAEVAAACEIDGRVRALAARFERAAGAPGWRCTVLRLG